jgi:hypothetical protein
LAVEVLEDRTLLSTFTVDHLPDDLVGSGLNGSLRYALTHAVDNDTVTFAVTGTINLNGVLPALIHRISIEGPGANSLTVRRDTGGDYRVFLVQSTVVVSNLTIAGGYAGTGLVQPGYGGGILDYGTLTLTNAVVRGNYAFAEGGGIYNSGTLTVNNSEVSGNGTTYAFSQAGGGIYNDRFATVTLNSSTISDNSTPGGEVNGGGGIANGGTMTLNNSTVSGNAADSGGGIANDGTLHALNTIIAGNTNGDISGNLGSLGHNLIGNTGGGSGFDPSDLLNVAPLLGPLQNNGGPTQTMALLPGSPAINAGDPSQLGTADQRGVVRTGGVNIGAYQASATALALTAPATVTAGTPFDVTVKAVDPFGQTALGYRGIAHFCSTDSQAGLPSDYTFTSTDAGMHSFISGVTLKTAGTQSVTATDTATASITGSASVSVIPAAADHLLFLQQPTDTSAGQTTTVTVAAMDQFGNVVTSDNSDIVMLSIGTNPSGGTLSGTLTVTVTGGIATFTDLSIDLVGDGYTLHATTTSLTDADSDAFSITA